MIFARSLAWALAGPTESVSPRFRFSSVICLVISAANCAGRPDEPARPTYFVEIADATGLQPGDPFLSADGFGAGRVVSLTPRGGRTRVAIELLPGDWDPKLRTGDWIAVTHGDSMHRGTLRVVHGDPARPPLQAGGELPEFPPESIVARHERYEAAHAAVMCMFDSLHRVEQAREPR